MATEDGALPRVELRLSGAKLDVSRLCRNESIGGVLVGEGGAIGVHTIVEGSK